MAGGRILIAEDQVIIAHALRQTLKHMGHDVLAIVFSGEQAIQKAAQLRPDLVLMDVVLKGEMDGIQAATRIQAEFGIPSIFVTAYANNVLLQRAVAKEWSYYLAKPIVERDLQQTIEMVLNSHNADKKADGVELPGSL